jgi:TIR domain
MSEPVRVFISYASADRAFAQRLVNDLQAAGAEVWWDVSSIDEGDFLGKINAALQQCQWLVLVLTPNAVASKWVNLEVNAAINRREKGLMRGVLPMLASQMAHDAIPPVWDNLHRYDGVGNYRGEVALPDPHARPIWRACRVATRAASYPYRPTCARRTAGPFPTATGKAGVSGRLPGWCRGDPATPRAVTTKR